MPLARLSLQRLDMMLNPALSRLFLMLPLDKEKPVASAHPGFWETYRHGLDSSDCPLNTKDCQDN